MAGQVAGGTPSQEKAQSQPASPWACLPQVGHTQQLSASSSQQDPALLQHADTTGLLTVPAMSHASSQPSPPAAGLPVSWLPAPARVSL